MRGTDGWNEHKVADVIDEGLSPELKFRIVMKWMRGTRSHKRLTELRAWVEITSYEDTPIETIWMPSRLKSWWKRVHLTLKGQKASIVA